MSLRCSQCTTLANQSAAEFQRLPINNGTRASSELARQATALKQPPLRALTQRASHPPGISRRTRFRPLRRPSSRFLTEHLGCGSSRSRVVPERTSQAMRRAGAQVVRRHVSGRAAGCGRRPLLLATGRDGEQHNQSNFVCFDEIPSIYNEVVVRYDGGHFTGTMRASLAPLLDERLRQLGIELDRLAD